MIRPPNAAFPSLGILSGRIPLLAFSTVLSASTLDAATRLTESTHYESVKLLIVDSRLLWHLKFAITGIQDSYDWYHPSIPCMLTVIDG